MKKPAIRDPFFRDIVSQLGTELDPQLFERCIADLLRPEWPTLVPVTGGSDFGVDGAVGVPKESPIPLVVTTASAVLANLKKSLKRYVESGGKQRSAIVVTSQRLTPGRRRNLDSAAAKVGFKLLQVYTQQAIADRLYHNPRWTQELLGLTGNPAALSLFPITDRPLVGDALIGREKDLAWLLGDDRDLLLVGQPGSGKTFLMHISARRAAGLFVISSNLTNIANDLREKQPQFVIVDDAHVHIQLLRDLRQLRQETLGRFRILANCWPGDQDSVQRALGIDESGTRALELLTRDEIVDVLKSVGITSPTNLIHELVNQADGRPGFAVTLAQFWLRGDVKSVANADALYRDVVHTFRPLLGDEATTVLAAFAIGGDYGMRLDVVAASLSMPPHALRAAVTRLAAGGVLTDTGGQRLSVRPAALRHALVRDVFFADATSIPPTGLLASVPDIDEAVRTIIGARARGGRVPDSVLHDLLPNCRSASTWAMFVRLGQSETEWVLAQRPDLLTSIGEAALEEWPTGVVPLLLNAAIGDERPLGPNPGHPLRLLGDWISEGIPGTPQAISRRKLFVNLFTSWLDQGGDVNVGVHAAGLALSPGYEGVSNNPGSKPAITISWGLLSRSELKALEALWPPVLAALSSHRPAKWAPIFELFHNWLFPGKGPLSIPEDIQKQMTAFAARMAKDVAELATDRPGVLHMLRRTMERSEYAELDVTVDPEFEVLYPVREFGTNLHDEEKEQAEAARKLATAWLGQSIADVVRRFAVYEREAQLSRISWPRWSVFVCEQVAAATDQPLRWATELRSANMRGELLHPVLRRLLEIGGSEEIEFVRQCLDLPDLRRSAVAAVLIAKGSTPALVQLSLDRVEGMGEWLGFLAAQGSLSDDTTDYLLGHTDSVIASAVAGGLWHNDRSKAATRPGWRAAVIASTADHDINLEDVFRTHPDIAAEWLRARMTENSNVFWRHGLLVEAATKALTVDQRRTLLDEVESEVWGNDLVTALVGNDLELYRTLLRNTELRRYHLSPLHGQPDAEWIPKAILALEARYSAEELVEAAVGGISGWSGSASAMWGEWIGRFDALKENADERIQVLGKLGSDLADQNRMRAIARERAEAVSGRF